MEQVNKFTEAVNQMNSLHNANTLVARSTDNSEYCDNSDYDEVSDGRNRVTSHETDRSLYHGTDLAASFLSHQETSLSSVATTGKPEHDSMMGSVLKEFSESYNQANENCGEPASDEITKIVLVAFKETLSESAFKNLLTKVTFA